MKLLFERSRPGRGQNLIPACDVPVCAFDASLLRAEAPKLPEISEVDLGRHYTELAKQTHGVNDGFYPLGSCTMKYNPRVNEEMAPCRARTRFRDAWKCSARLRGCCVRSRAWTA